MRRPSMSVALALAFASCTSLALAHQPRIVEPGAALVRVDQPEVSKAYYGELNGEPHFFAVRSDKPFILYVNILVPRIPGVRRDVSVGIRDERNRLLATLGGPRSRWSSFHEPFGGDDYYQGPEFRREVPPGRYDIKVFSISNRGKYVLAVGQKEEFPFREVMRTLSVLPRLKSQFFGRSPFTVLLSYTGAFFLVTLVVIVAVVYALARWIRAASRERRTKG